MPNDSTAQSKPNPDQQQPASSTDNLQKEVAELKQKFQQKYTQSYQWLEKKFSNPQELNQFTQQLIAAITLASQLAVHQPVEAQVRKNLEFLQQDQEKDLLDQITEQELEEIIQKMISYVNMEPGHLPREDELYLEQQLTDLLGFSVAAELEDQRLNHSVGIMGGEQHLKRYPGDTLQQHDAYQEAGMAPQRGAYGWFTEDGELTEQAIMREKYYFAVQTMYLPNWHTDYEELKPWYKFRKMIVINPAEQLAVVAVVGDAGPAMWVKKQFGGSPEVIREGKIWSPAAKGRVLLFFVDDPDDQVPLGPIDLEKFKNNIQTNN